jgi:uridine kinase
VARPYVIGITGGSASGKTTITNRLIELLPEYRFAVLHQDRYFKDFTFLPDAERELLATANNPDALVWPEFLEQFHRLLEGRAVTEPVPFTRLSRRAAAPVTIEPGDILIVEGLFALWHDGVRAEMDLRIYMEVDDDERVLRRIARDIVERGGTVPNVIAWYRKDVAPNFPKITKPTARLADVVVPNHKSCDVAVRLIADGVRAQLRERAEGHAGTGNPREDTR